MIITSAAESLALNLFHVCRVVILKTSDQPRGAGVAERAEGPDLAGAAGAPRRPQPATAGRLPLRPAPHRTHRRRHHPQLQVSPSRSKLIIT